jgi:hypothetical protein
MQDSIEVQNLTQLIKYLEEVRAEVGNVNCKVFTFSDKPKDDPYTRSMEGITPSYVRKIANNLLADTNVGMVIKLD